MSRSIVAAATALVLSAVSAPAWSQATLEGMPTPSVGSGLKFTLPPQWSIGGEPGTTDTLYIFGPAGTKVRCMVNLGANNFPADATQAELDRNLREGGPHRVFDAYAEGQPIIRNEERIVDRDGRPVLRAEITVQTPAGTYLFHGLYATSLKLYYGIACGGPEADWTATAAEIESIVSTFEVLD